ncbi:MAG: V-type ATP synthase subunit E [Methanocalculaceae archaeon]|jgi:V/A-type H+-transporting ATPase subunit E|nr:V-type ATP synthase subunit E [Methanocalculaceae archaeon]
MGLEVVVNEIKVKGDREAARIKSEADAEAKIMVAEATKRAEEIRIVAETDATLQADRIMIRETAAANLVVKRDLLNAQKELLDKVYNEAAKEITNLPVDIHAKAVRSLLKDAVKQIKEGIVYANQRDEEATKAALLELKTLSGFTFGGITDIDGGVVVQSIDGKFTLDLSYRTFMGEVWESSLKNASEILFEANT